MKTLELRPVVSRALMGFITVLVLSFLLILLPVIVFMIIIPGSISSPVAVSGLIILFCLVWFWIFFLAVGTVKNTQYFVSDKFVSYRRQFLSRDWSDLPISQITNVDYSISAIWDKVFGTGSILFYSAGSNSADVVISHVKNVERTYEQINSVLNLRRSASIAQDGSLKRTVRKAELIKRIQPTAGLACVLETAPWLFTLFVFGAGIIVIPVVAMLTYKAYKKKYFDFYTDKLEYYDGFFTLNKKTVPIERITNVDTSQQLFDRIFGTSTIIVQTAGSAQAEILLKYVPEAKETVDYLKKELRKHGRN